MVLVQFNHSVTLIDTYEHTNRSEGEGATVIKLNKYPLKFQTICFIKENC